MKQHREWYTKKGLRANHPNLPRLPKVPLALVKMPDGETRFIKPIDVREGRVVLWPAGAPLPSRLENVGGHWKVFAAPFIAARKSAEDDRNQVQGESLRHSHAPGC